MRAMLIAAVLVSSAGVAAKTVRLVFPSKRAINAPALAGRYDVDGDAHFDTLSYTETTAERGIVFSVVMAQTSSVSCADSHSSLDDATELKSDAMKALGVAWYVSYLQLGKTRRIRHACLTRKKGIVEVTIDDPVGAKDWPELEPVAVAVLANWK